MANSSLGCRNQHRQQENMEQNKKTSRGHVRGNWIKVERKEERDDLSSAGVHSEVAPSCLHTEALCSWWRFFLLWNLRYCSSLWLRVGDRCGIIFQPAVRPILVDTMSLEQIQERFL